MIGKGVLKSLEIILISLESYSKSDCAKESYSKSGAITAVGSHDGLLMVHRIAQKIPLSLWAVSVDRLKFLVGCTLALWTDRSVHRASKAIFLFLGYFSSIFALIFCLKNKKKICIKFFKIFSSFWCLNYSIKLTSYFS